MTIRKIGKSLQVLWVRPKKFRK